MMYPESMRESIKRLEATRKERMDQEFAMRTADQKKELLKGFHPDYIEESMRELAVGPNKGQRTPHELANVLEAYPVSDIKGLDFSNPDYDVDVLVIGGGGAGASAALVAQEAGANVLLVTKLRVGDANTRMAQGGIQGADKPNDSPERHYLDVLGGGHFKNVPELAKALVMDAPGVIAWLEKLGVMFDKEDDGTMKTIHGGGTSRKRMHFCRDYTGAEIMRVLRDEMLNHGIPEIEFAAAVELLTDTKGTVTGAVLVNLETGQKRVVRAKTTILATGGCGRLHMQGFPCTNHYGATADGLVLAYRVGAELAFIDTIQYHPTGVAYPEQIVGLLITEKVRSLGAHLVNSEGNRFIYELESRDITASAIIRECRDQKKGIDTPTGGVGVWLDSPMLDVLKGEGFVRNSLPAMFHQFARYDIEMDKVPVLTYPTQHYQNGGVLVDDTGHTGAKNLFAAGETVGGIHGRNRLMGNSLLDILVFGRRAGKAAAEAAKAMKQAPEIGAGHVGPFVEELKAAGVPKDRRSPKLLPDYRRPEMQGRYPFLGQECPEPAAE
jgi:succinate dehydrogenase / fumarate reductase flavoprotein subunit